MDFEVLEAKRARVPWRPPLKDDMDASHFERYEEEDSIQPFDGDDSVFNGF